MLATVFGFGSSSDKQPCMRLACLWFFLCFISWNFCLAQTPLEWLTKNGDLENNRQYAFMRLDEEELKHLDSTKLKELKYCEGGVLFIPNLVTQKRIDTLNIKLEYDSLPLLRAIYAKDLRRTLFAPAYAEKHCLNIDASENTKVYQFRFIDFEIPPLYATYSICDRGHQSEKEFVNTFNNELHTEEYEIKIQPAIQWLPIEKWNPKNKIKLEFGLMDSAYEDKKGNKYILFEKGYYNEMREVFCSSCHSSNLVKQIQISLKEKGYDVPINNVMCRKTKNAILDFQKKNDLDYGALNEATLKVLRIGDY